MKNFILFALILTIGVSQPLKAQDYFLGELGPFDPKIPSPETFLGYPIGSQHTRHDLIVAYFEHLASLSDRASLTDYGRTHEKRRLVILNISTPEQISNLESIRQNHLATCDPDTDWSYDQKMPVFVNLGYNVHGNEPSSSEAAMLTAYTLIAGQNDDINRYLEEAVVFVDPTINPDGRDRHTQWANTYQGHPWVYDPMDAEHNEAWPRGRTNHYWFDLNRDWLLGIHPESRGKLTWYHQWYPNVVTDFHEMGTNSTYFFEPMKANGSKDPIMPKENYTTLNETFAKYFVKDLDKIGSLYFTKEVFDGTYPGYGSSYPDLQGGLGLLFEQASSRGHGQETPMGKITFPFTIRNQFTSSLATIKASIESKETLFRYQNSFFKSATQRAERSSIKGYVFGDSYDQNRVRAFLDKLLLHQVKVYNLKSRMTRNGKSYQPGRAYFVPVNQVQYRMVQTVFETYASYTDSVFYDASAWSLANFYNLNYAAVNGNVDAGEQVLSVPTGEENSDLPQSDYAYLIPWEDYNAPAVLQFLKSRGVMMSSAFKPFSIDTHLGNQSFGYGTLMIPIQKQQVSTDALYRAINEAKKKYVIPVFAVSSGYSSNGIDLGSGSFRSIKELKAAMLIGDGVSSYEAGEVWHLMDTRVGAPISKLPLRLFDRVDLSKYTSLVMVSGSYHQLDSIRRQRIKNWVSKGNTLITIRQGTAWAIEQGIAREKLIEKEKDQKAQNGQSAVTRKPYVNARENRGKQQVGGAIFEVDLDITHPLGFGYRDSTLPVYRNSTVWLAPSKNPYSTVAKYTSDPHIDGFISAKNLNEFLKPSASLIVSQVGRGRVIMFADNPNFRGSWYGTNKLFLNALFLGAHINVPQE